MSNKRVDKSIKILYLIPAEGFGGAEKQAILHISHLPAQHIDISVISGPGTLIMDHFQKRGIQVHHCRYLPTEFAQPFNVIAYILYLVKTFANWIYSLFFILNIVHKDRVNLIFASRVAGWSLAGPISTLSGIPCIWRFGSCVHGKWRKLGLKLLSSAFSPDLIVSNCSAVSKSVNGVLDSPRIELPNGVEDSRVNQRFDKADFRMRFNIPADIPVIGLAARPSPDKGMNFLADVVSTVKKSGVKTLFCVAGEFGWRKKIEGTFQQQGLSNDIRFLGHIDNISHFFITSDIVILTSREHSIEGLPNSLMEAMALGCPVVSTNVGGISTMIENGKTGILTAATDTVGFSKAIIKLLADPSRRECLGNAARESVLNRYSAEQVAQSLAEIISCTIDNYRLDRQPYHEIPNPDYVISNGIIDA